MSLVRLLLSLLVLTLGWAGWASSGAGGEAAVELTPYQVKAIYLYNFLLYVRWPQASDKYVIGILGHDPLDAAMMQEISGRTLGENKDKRIIIRRFATMADYEPCHLLFISPFPAEGREGETAEDRLRAAVKQTRGAPVLLVSDTAGFALKGAMINLYLAPHHTEADKTVVKMEINLERAKNAGLEISSELLKLKKVVTIVPAGAGK